MPASSSLASPQKIRGFIESDVAQMNTMRPSASFWWVYLAQRCDLHGACFPGSTKSGPFVSLEEPGLMRCKDMKSHSRIGHPRCFFASLNNYRTFVVAVLGGEEDRGQDG